MESHSQPQPQSQQQQQQQQQFGLAFHQQHVAHDSAMSVGSSKEDDAERIRELEDEVHTLAEKATAASQRYADYENEIRVLEAKLRQEQRKNAAAQADSPATGTPLAAAPSAVQRPGISRFNSFMSPRKVSPSAANGAISPIAPDKQKELEEQVVKEQTARIAAEKKAKQVSAEIEELSATLFEQANEMVASERKENSLLKGRVEVLERLQKEQEHERAASPSPTSLTLPQMAEAADTAALQKENDRLKEKIYSLETREAQRVKRLERLEAANRRIERVRAMLKPP